MALFEEVSEMLTGGENLGALSTFLGSDSGQASSLLGMAGPALLGALGNRSATPTGADALFGLANNADAGILDNIGGFLSGGDAGGMGGKLVSSLFGSRRDAVETGLAHQAGVSSGVVAKLMPMLAPVVMGFLKKKIMGGGMNASGLAGLLGENTKAMRSGGLGGILDMLDGGDSIDEAGFLDGVKSMAGIGGATAAADQVTNAAGMDSAAVGAAGDMADEGSSKLKWLLPLVALLALAAIFLISRGGDDASAAGPVSADDCETVDEVTLQLKWFAQAQFAGYYAAADEGLYAARCLDVTILEGGLDTQLMQAIASGDVDYSVAWTPAALVAREQGLDVVNVGQIFQRSGTLQVSFADSGIETPADLAGRKVGSWGFGNEFELLAGSRNVGLVPGSDYEVVPQNFDMQALINGEVDAAQAMSYNEYALVLETINPATGELFTADDLNVIDWNDEGTAMLQDGLWTDGARLDDPEFRDITTRFLAASIEGWAWCRDNADGCVDVVLANGTDLGRSHQSWQLNEISNLIWPSPNGAGVIDSRLWNQTIEVATSEAVLESNPQGTSFTNDFAVAARALAEANGYDVIGNDFQLSEIVLTEGGQ